MVIYTCIVLVINEELIHHVLSWTWVHICAFVLGPVLFFASVSIFSSTSAFALSGIDYWFASCRSACLLACLSVDFCARSLFFCLTVLLFLSHLLSCAAL